MSSRREKLPSLRSMLALSAFVFLIADVQGGVGPFLSVYLRGYLHWDVNQIGMALGTLNLVMVFSQIPGGILIDSVSAKRLLIGLAAVMIALACLFITIIADFSMVIVAQGIMGVASSIVPPAITAITLGLVGAKHFAKRISINGTFNHAGNVFTALTTGLLAHSLGIKWILYVVVIFCFVSLAPLVLIKKNEINHRIARELPEFPTNGAQSFKPVPKLYLFTHKPIIFFCISALLFQFSNAIQLPLVGEELAKISPERAYLFMASSIILAQVVMIIVTYSLGFILDKVARKRLFIIAFATLIVRAILYIFIKNTYILLALQILDGMASGIYSITSIVIISELGRGTGRFNFLQGLVAFCVGIGAALSNIVGGYVAKILGLNISFLTLALIAFGGMIFFTIFVPETKNYTQAYHRK